jgi:hypothetical protein
MFPRFPGPKTTVGLMIKAFLPSPAAVHSLTSASACSLVLPYGEFGSGIVSSVNGNGTEKDEIPQPGYSHSVQKGFCSIYVGPVKFIFGNAEKPVLRGQMDHEI